ncbi:MAG: hypothetical protein M0C28_23795 [Candidatus Moduliflexus flocculans]|nr:hypothetical protein [Candidatus Moduliflexus flocculans]
MPVYLYEAAARKPERRNLATVRAGRIRGPGREAQGPALGARLRRSRRSTPSPGRPSSAPASS